MTDKRGKKQNGNDNRSSIVRLRDLSRSVDVLFGKITAIILAIFVVWPAIGFKAGSQWLALKRERHNDRRERRQARRAAAQDEAS